MKRIVAGLVSVVFVTVGALAEPRVVGKPVVDKTLAVVNGSTIFESEFNNIVLPVLEQYRQNVPASDRTAQAEIELKDTVLDQKIRHLLLKQEVAKQKIKVSKQELQDIVNEIKKKDGNESALEIRLKKANITMADFEKHLSEILEMDKLLKQFVQPKVKIPSEIEVRDLYDKVVMKMKGTKANLSPAEDALVSDLAEKIKRMTGEHVRLRQIFVNCPKDANETTLKTAQSRIATIKKELQKQTFANVAAQYSEDSISKAVDGDLGIIAEGDLSPSVNKIAFSMKVGDYTKDPIKTSAGYYFIKVEERHAKTDITFANVKNGIIQALHRNNEEQAVMDYTDTLKSKASIKINKTW